MAKSTEKTITKAELKEKLLDILHNDYQTTPDDATDQQVYEALSKIVVGILKAKRRKFTVATQSAGKKKVYYLSMEFLMGRSLKTSLYNLEMNKQAAAVLKDLGIDRRYMMPFRVVVCAFAVLFAVSAIAAVVL